ncbi:hypothetical protein BH11PAT4_BH11PAT4_5920 [soil metagenome]
MRRHVAGNTTLIVAAAVVALVLIVGGAFVVGIGSNPGSPVRDQKDPNPVDLTNTQTQALAKSLDTKIDSCKAVRDNEKYLTELSNSLTDEGSIGAYITSSVTDAGKRTELNTMRQEANAALQSIITKAAECGTNKNTNGLDKEISDLWATVRQKIISLQAALVKSLAGKYYFPGVEQGAARYCQQASAAMVALTYLSNYGATPITQLDAPSLPAALQKALGPNTSAGEYPVGWAKLNNDPDKIRAAIASHASIPWFTTPRNPTMCSVGDMHFVVRLFKAIGSPMPDDWAYISDDGFAGVITPDFKISDPGVRDKAYAALKLSLTAIPPDPVVIDFTNLAACSYAHNIPLFMFNGTKFITNNPGKGSVKYNQTTCGRKDLSEANVKNFNRLVIRQKYLTAVGLTK